jgi:hypothetical protein
VAHLNIERYRRLLATEMDETKRQTILHLLAEEEAKLIARHEGDGFAYSPSTTDARRSA